MSAKTLFYFLAFVFFALAAGGRISWFLSGRNALILPKNKEITFKAVLWTEPKVWERGQVLLIGDSKFYVDFYPKYSVGDEVKVSGVIDGAGRSFDAKVAKVGKESSARSTLSSLRAKIAQNIGAVLPSREGSLVLGTVLGLNRIDKVFSDQLIKTGTIHVVVVSGQNLSIVAGIFIALAHYIGRKQSLMLATVAVFFYALLTGFEPPVVRASIMVLLTTVAVYFGRETWPAWILFLSACLILFFWPGAILDLSFQLTFAATFGIITLGQYLTKLFNFRSPAINLVWQNAAVATSAFLFTAPIIYLNFERVSFISPLVNTLVSEAVFPLMVLGFLTVIAGLIFAPLAVPFAYLAFVPAFYFVKVVEIFSRL